MKKIILIVILIVSSSISFGQKTIVGNVSDESKKPLSDVIVKIKGESNQTVTDLNGNYSIIIKEKNSVLSFKKEGYNLLELSANKNLINVVMTSLNVDYFELSLEELMNIDVVSASNTQEKLSEVPATMIVITSEDILQRGYTQLDDIFEDLPGMQISRPYGMQSNYRNYWRGYRNSFTEPYLMMVDGLLLNDMYFGSAMYTPSIPLSNIERIEVVYGPVSSVYGANAFMGVINIITQKNLTKDGTLINAQTSNNFNDAQYTDIHVLVKKNDLRLSVAGKIQSYNLSDYIDNNSYEYLKDKYQNDKKLWGGTLSSSEYGGSTKGPRNEKGIDTRLFYGNTEIGLHVNIMEAGMGYEYPTDKSFVSTIGVSEDFKIYFKHDHKFAENFFGRFLMAYRSNIDDNEDYIEGYNITNNGTENMVLGGGHILSPNNSARVIDNAKFLAYSNSYIAQQDFDFKLEKLSLSFGLKYEQKSASNQFINYGKSYFPDSLKSPADEGFLAKGISMQEIKTFLHKQKEFGTYIQSKYKITDNHILNLGMRLDNNSEYGTNTTIRAGYIGKFGKFIGKMLYGQAYQAPYPRTLYGVFSAAGSSINLKPEESETFEASITYTKNKVSSTISAYHIINTNTIVQFSGGAKNAGKRQITGLDLHLRGELKPSFIKKIQVWAYYSIILNDEEKKFDENDNEVGKDIIGDLSYNNINLGLTGVFNEHITLNLIGRYVGERKTISTNPIDKIDPYFTLNANILYKNIFVKGLSLRLKVNNLLNTQYFHPGIKNADAGETSGYWEGNKWIGSTGWFNSKLPQPHRYFLISLLFNM